MEPEYGAMRKGTWGWGWDGQPPTCPTAGEGAPVPVAPGDRPLSGPGASPTGAHGGFAVGPGGTQALRPSGEAGAGTRRPRFPGQPLPVAQQRVSDQDGGARGNASM